MKLSAPKQDLLVKKLKQESQNTSIQSFLNSMKATRGKKAERAGEPVRGKQVDFQALKLLPEDEEEIKQVIATSFKESKMMRDEEIFRSQLFETNAINQIPNYIFKNYC